MAEQLKLWFKLEDKPPFVTTIGYAFQHVCSMVPAATVPPLLVGSALGIPVLDIAKWISLTLFGMGIATILQSLLGTRYPIIQGASYSFISPYIVVGTMAGAGVGSIPVIMMALILGGLVEAIIGFSGLLGLIRRVLTPLVIGIIICLICLSFFGFVIESCASNWIVAIIVAITMLACSQIIPRLVPRIAQIQTFSYLIGMGLGYVICVALGIVDFTPIAQRPWLVLPRPFPWGLPRFNISALIAILAGFFASTIESYGDYHACAAALGEPMPDKRRIGRGIGMEGVACTVNGIFGGIATTSLTENIGIIGLTGVGARRVVWVAGIQMIVFGVIGKVGGVFATLPSSVLGGAWLIVFGLVVGYGVQWMSKGGLNDVRNVAIVGICLLIGLGVPQLLAGNPIVVGGVSDKGLAGILNAFLAVPMVNGGIVAIILEHILPGKMSQDQVEAVLKGKG